MLKALMEKIVDMPLDQVDNVNTKMESIGNNQIEILEIKNTVTEIKKKKLLWLSHQ